MHILLIEDDRDLAAVLRISLQRDGHTVDVEHNGLRAEEQAQSDHYDALIVDWMLPGQDGRTLTEHLRAAGSEVPILMLTAKGSDESVVAGLDAGADDYVQKPVAPKVLAARLRALTRRSSRQEPDETIAVENLRLHVLRRQASLNGGTLDLRTKEYVLLELLARRAGDPVSREEIASTVWAGDEDVREATLNITVSTLRKKLMKAQPKPAGVLIKTVRGVGYKLVTV